MPKLYPNLDQAIRGSKERLMLLGQEFRQENWQSVPSPGNTWEVLDTSFKSQIPFDLPTLKKQTRPNLPWADKHFQERISGLPSNPGESYKDWPHFKHVGESFKLSGVFSHTYMERFWPKLAGNTIGIKYEGEDFNKGIKEYFFTDKPKDSTHPKNLGIRYSYGDLKSVVDLLVRDPSTRQAYIPIWFPEDTGAQEGQRVPCTIGYWIVRRYGFLHITYYIRSCDIIRHFRDDIYMAVRLLYWLLSECREKDPNNWNSVYPGYFTMHIGSLHCFINEVGLLKLDKT